MAFHVNYTYQQQTQRGPTGWSENFWYDGSLDAARVAAVSLAPYLRNVHSKNALMQTIHIREVSNFPVAPVARNSTAVAVNESPADAAGRLSGMYPTTACRISLYDSAGQSNDVWLKGMPDGIDTEGYLTPPPTWAPLLAALLAQFSPSGNNWVRRILDTSQPKKAITGISTLGVVTCTAHGYANNVLVRIGRTTSSPNIDGLYRISVGSDPNTFTLVGFRPLSAAPEMTKRSYVQLQEYTTAPITSAVAEVVTKKNVGRPTGAPTGRQTTARS